MPKWTYEVEPELEIKAGQYIASISRRDGGVASVWLITAARRIKHKQVLETQAWALEVVAAPEVKAGAVYEPEQNQLWVRGEPAHPFFWYPRNAK